MAPGDLLYTFSAEKFGLKVGLVVRSEREKWEVPESDPAGNVPNPTGATAQLICRRRDRPRSRCIRPNGRRLSIAVNAALNPATNHYCAACGATMVDAFRATEGLRVYDRPDTASRMIEIIPAGSELDLVDDPDAPADFMRVKLEYGRLGYVRVADISVLAGDLTQVADPLGAPDINVNARGCVTQSGALLALGLLLALTVLTLVYMSQTDVEEQGIIALAACVSLGPLLLVTIAIYVYARSRDERLEAEAEYRESER